VPFPSVMEDRLALSWIIPISFGNVSSAPRPTPRRPRRCRALLTPARAQVYGHFVILNITIMARKFSVQVPARAGEEQGVFMSLCQRAEASPRLRAASGCASICGSTTPSPRIVPFCGAPIP
jgi:hypothetical protein